MLFVDGNPTSEIFFISESWNTDPETEKIPAPVHGKEGNGPVNLYEGRAGELFLKILDAMNLSRERIFLVMFDPLDYSRVPLLRTAVAAIKKELESLLLESPPRIICTLG
ncbi:MAG: hypothetical protein HQK66_04725, partial [Desulfamplus sp.]|nr:hypothetical protein [Desulfamplus sp.]